MTLAPSILMLKLPLPPCLPQWVNKDTGLDDWMHQSARDADRFTDWGFDQWDQWRRGYDALVHHLTEAIPDGKIRMFSPVCKIFWDQDEDARVLVVTQDGASYLADHVIVTASVGHLKDRQASLFEPALPQKYREALAVRHRSCVTELGLADKVQLGWESPWWGHTNFSLNIIFTNNILGERSWLKGIMEFLTVHNQGSMLQAFVPGEYAKKMENLGEKRVKQHLVSFLSDVMGQRIPEPTFFRRTQWQKNVWMRGSYNSYVTVEGGNTVMRNSRQPLAQSVEKFGKPVLLWAGEHTHTTRYGTVDGAMDTGEREAKKIIAYRKATRG
ncbi:spermine oxidase-like [Penaeus indicus]|uniref:spermine oxidase-like n=1 Tax=Penaeus indicus TaxID=29960 RepID=UPI00300C817F